MHVAQMLRTLIAVMALLLGANAVSGCAALVGGAAGGATGYVAGHEAAEEEKD